MLYFKILLFEGTDLQILFDSYLIFYLLLIKNESITNYNESITNYNQKYHILSVVGLILIVSLGVIDDGYKSPERL